jgi:hypothetical protein
MFKDLTPFKMAVCVDCMLLICNGDDPSDEQDHHERDDARARLDNDPITPGWIFTESEQEIFDNGGEVSDDLGFSWSRCDYCLSRLGGDRFRATAWMFDA